MNQVVEDLESKMRQLTEWTTWHYKSNYQNLRKDLMEVQDLQKQLSSSLHVQLKVLQAKFNMLKEKVPLAPNRARIQGEQCRNGGLAVNLLNTIF
ncbi:hypothetical protein JTB14_000893 [Gonioctena quinquepunctata]|nr:hypothetical protein JTB14_000893 [Gonioctena quinquepunctata]